MIMINDWAFGCYKKKVIFQSRTFGFIEPQSRSLLVDVDRAVRQFGGMIGSITLPQDTFCANRAHLKSAVTETVLTYVVFHVVDFFLNLNMT